MNNNSFHLSGGIPYFGYGVNRNWMNDIASQAEKMYQIGTRLFSLDAKAPNGTRYVQSGLPYEEILRLKQFSGSY